MYGRRQTSEVKKSFHMNFCERFLVWICSHEKPKRRRRVDRFSYKIIFQDSYGMVYGTILVRTHDAFILYLYVIRRPFFETYIIYTRVCIFLYDALFSTRPIVRPIFGEATISCGCSCLHTKREKHNEGSTNFHNNELSSVLH